MAKSKKRRRSASRRRRRMSPVKALLLAIAAVPALYLMAALVGSLVPVNRHWSETAQGTTIFIADNGVHTDLILPARAQGLDWRPLLPAGDARAADPQAPWIAFGSGERRVYLDTPRWRDIRPGALWAALIGGERIMHVEHVANPGYAVREIRLRPEEYRRLWAAIRADFVLDARGRPILIDHPGYGPNNAFYRAVGKASAVRTCNTATADRLRLAGVRTSLWPPFAQGLTWRYRKVHST